MSENICRNTTGSEDDSIDVARGIAAQFSREPEHATVAEVVTELINIIERLDKALSQKDDEATEASNRAFEAENSLGSLKQKLTELAG